MAHLPHHPASLVDGLLSEKEYAETLDRIEDSLTRLRQRTADHELHDDIDRLLMEIEDAAPASSAAYATLTDSRNYVPDGPERRRIAVSIKMTRPGNMTVNVVPAFYDDADGDWHEADEWDVGVPMERLPKKPTERSPVELLRVSGVAPLCVGFDEYFHRPFISRWRYDEEGNVPPILREAVARFAVAGFGRAVRFLARRFDVSIMEYPILNPAAVLPSDPKLVVVDARTAYRNALRASLARLQARPGSSGAAHPELEKAHRHGLVDPASGRMLDEQGDRDRDFGRIAVQARRRVLAHRERIYGGDPLAILATLAPLAAPRPSSAAPASGAPSPVRRSRPRQPPSGPPAAEPRAAEPTRLPDRRPRAAAPRALAPLPEDIAAEFGVSDARELLEKYNAILRERGERELPEGNYPSSKSNLAVLIQLYRHEKDGPPAPRR